MMVSRPLVPRRIERPPTIKSRLDGGFRPSPNNTEFLVVECIAFLRLFTSIYYTSALVFDNHRNGSLRKTRGSLRVNMKSVVVRITSLEQRGSRDNYFVLLFIEDSPTVTMHRAPSNVFYSSIVYLSGLAVRITLSELRQLERPERERNPNLEES